MKTPNKTSA